MTWGRGCDQPGGSHQAPPVPPSPPREGPRLWHIKYLIGSKGTRWAHQEQLSPPQPPQPAQPPQQHHPGDPPQHGGLPPSPSCSHPPQGTPKRAGGRAESQGGAEPSQALPSRARAQAGSPWGCRVTPLARPPDHCRGEIFRGIIIRDSMVRISGTGEGKEREREREVRAGGAQGGMGSPARAGGPQSGWGPCSPV